MSATGPSLTPVDGFLNQVVIHGTGHAFATEPVGLRPEPPHGASPLASADRARVAVYDSSLRVYTVATDTMTSASSVSSVSPVGLDETTLVALTPHGFSVAPVSAAVPT